MPKLNPEKLVTFNQLVEAHTWMTTRWLRRAVEQKRIPYYKVDGRLLFDLDEVEQYVVRNRQEPKTGRRLRRPTKKAE